MKGKKVIHWRGPGGNGGPVLISSWRCNFSIYLDIQVYYLDIQAIITLLSLILFRMCWLLLFIHFSMLQLLSWKVTFPALKTTRIQEFWTYKDGTRFILKRNEVSIGKYTSITYSFSFFFFSSWSSIFFQKKLCDVQKNFKIYFGW